MVEAFVFVQLADETNDVARFLFAHTGGRLVEQQQPRLQRQRHHDLGGALIAMRELADKALSFRR